MVLHGYLERTSVLLVVYYRTRYGTRKLESMASLEILGIEPITRNIKSLEY